jgi:hypothetical protein
LRQIRIYYELYWSAKAEATTNSTQSRESTIPSLSCFVGEYALRAVNSSRRCSYVEMRHRLTLISDLFCISHDDRSKVPEYID